MIVYRDKLLYPSETFIKAQGEGLRDYKPYYVGSRKVLGLELPQERTIVLNPNSPLGWLKESIFKAGPGSFGFAHKLRKLNPCLLHAHFGPDGVLALPLAQRLKLPLVVTFHGFDATIRDEEALKKGFYHKNYVLKRSRLQERGDLFIAVSSFIRSGLLKQGYPEEKIVQHYIGIDLMKFIPDPKIERRPLLLFVGRLEEKKGCAYFLKAANLLQKTLQGLEVGVIGDGSQRKQLEEYAAKNIQHCRFLGCLDHIQVKHWLNQARVFCVPSHVAGTGDAEGFGMVFAEAAAMGVPVVSFNSGGVSEAVAHGETGFLASERDWQPMAAYILRLFQEEELWHKFSRQGQERVKRMFDLNKQCTKLEKIYDEVIARKR
jgi:colanic acid/amylovoran biosynthesis glycosyltransferase